MSTAVRSLSLPALPAALCSAENLKPLRLVPRTMVLGIDKDSKTKVSSAKSRENSGSASESSGARNSPKSQKRHSHSDKKKDRAERKAAEKAAKALRLESGQDLSQNLDLDPPTVQAAESGPIPEKQSPIPVISTAHTVGATGESDPAVVAERARLNELADEAAAAQFIERENNANSRNEKQSTPPREPTVVAELQSSITKPGKTVTEHEISEDSLPENGSVDEDRRSLERGLAAQKILNDQIREREDSFRKIKKVNEEMERELRRKQLMEELLTLDPNHDPAIRKPNTSVDKTRVTIQDCEEGEYVSPNRPRFSEQSVQQHSSVPDRELQQRQSLGSGSVRSLARALAYSREHYDSYPGQEFPRGTADQDAGNRAQLSLPTESNAASFDRNWDQNAARPIADSHVSVTGKLGPPPGYVASYGQNWNKNPGCSIANSRVPVTGKFGPPPGIQKVHFERSDDPQKISSILKPASIDRAFIDAGTAAHAQSLQLGNFRPPFVDLTQTQPILDQNSAIQTQSYPPQSGPTLTRSQSQPTPTQPPDAQLAYQAQFNQQITTCLTSILSEMKETRKSNVQSEAEDEQGDYEYEEEYETDYQTDYTQYGSDTDYEPDYQTGYEYSAQDPHPPHQPWVEDSRWETEHQGEVKSSIDILKFKDQIELLDSRAHLKGTPVLLLGADPIRPGAPPSGNASRALAPHFILDKWYGWAEPLLSNDDISPGTPYMPAFLTASQKLFCNAGKASQFLAKPRETNRVFCELANIHADDIARVSNTANKSSAETFKALEKSTRVGLGAQSYAHHFHQGVAGENVNIDTILKSNCSNEDKLFWIEEANRAQWQFIDQAESCARDATGCLVNLDINLQLRKRDNLLSHLHPLFERSKTSLRAAPLNQVELFPNAQSVISTEQADGNTPLRILKAVLDNAAPKRKAPGSAAPQGQRQRKRRRTKSRGGGRGRGAGRGAPPRGTSFRGAGHQGARAPGAPGGNYGTSYEPYQEQPQHTDPPARGRGGGRGGRGGGRGRGRGRGRVPRGTSYAHPAPYPSQL